MAKRLKMTFDGGRPLYADLLWDEAPHTCAAFERAGRFESFVFAANVCFGEYTWNTPIRDFWEVEYVTPETHAGDVSFYADWSSVCLFSQEMEQYGLTSKFARVRPEDLPAFAEVGRRVWHEQGRVIRVVTEVVEEGE